MKIEFQEKQKFTQWWLLLVLGAIGLIPIFGLYNQIILGKEFGNNPLSNLGLIIFSLIIFLLIALIWFIQLTTEIDENEIRMQFFPFVKKKILWKDVKSTEIVNYGFAGGWGIRMGSKYGTIYNIKGNKGFAIELITGEKFLIGTQNEIELKKALEKNKWNTFVVTYQ